MLVTALTTAVVAGGLGVLATFLFLRSDAGEDDAAITCSEVGRIDLPLGMTELGLDEPLYWRLFGISGFASAAGHGDDAHAALDRPGQQLVAGLQRVDVDMMDEALQQLSTVCGDIGH